MRYNQARLYKNVRSMLQEDEPCYMTEQRVPDSHESQILQ